MAPTFTFTSLCLPMLVGIFAARGGNRKLAGELFEGGVARFTVQPYTQFIEYVDPQASGPQAQPATPYLANLGGFLMACLYGLTGLELCAGEPQQWCQRQPAMPGGWEGVEVERIWARGKPARLSARQGEARAKLEF